MALPSLVERLSDLPAFKRLLSTLPAGRERQRVSGIAGSADAVLVAALAAQSPNRMLTVVADQLPEAERWLADLQSIAGEEFVALYPPREGFGEVEPHAEVAGERVETLERMTRGEVRILLTTARAILERTRLPQALASARLELRRGDSWRLDALAAHLRAVGFERVEMVEDVAQFSVRGGIVDVYGFGMAEPVRLEFWGDEIVELRHFDLLTQRTSKPAEVALVLPVDVASAPETEERFERTTLAALFPPGTLLVVPAGVHLVPEMRRTWDEAAHHINLARRRGEEAAAREDLYQPPDTASASLAAFPSLEIVGAGEASDDAVVFPLRAPETIDRDMKRLAALVRGDMPTIILCDNSGQAERLDELLAARPGEPSPAALAIGVLGGGFVIPPSEGAVGLRVLTDHEIFRRERRIRRARRYATGVALEAVTALKVGDYVVHLEHGVGIYRGMSTIFAGETTIEVIVIEYEGGDRLNVPLYRIDQVERFRAVGDVSEDAPPPH
ncbi:MAG: CarD family transcriptional regulator, partial [Gemmatimonadaceae bacterium]